MTKNILNRLRGILFRDVPSSRVTRGTLTEVGYIDGKGNRVRVPITKEMLKLKQIPREMRQDPKEGPLDVYCQTCYRDLTLVEEVVLAEGGVYCQGYDGNVEGRCIDQAPRKSPLLVVKYIDQDWPSLIREAIDEGVLVNYGPLERSVN